MTLTDIMSHAGVSDYAVIALVLFFAVFVAVVWHTFAPKRRRELNDRARLPFEDGTERPTRRGVTR